MSASDGPVRLLVSDRFIEQHREQLSAYESVGRGLELVGLTGPETVGTEGEAAFVSFDQFPGFPAKVLEAAAAATTLKWFHHGGVGVDHPVFDSLLERGVRLTTSSGSSAVPIAQHAFMQLTALTRNLPTTLRNQERHVWERVPGFDLAGTTLVVAGMGPIGLEAARLGAAFRMHVIGLRRTISGDEPCETWTLDRLDEALARADHLILALPNAPETYHLIDARRLALLPRSASIINVGRGDLTDEDALLAALQSGQIGRAGLDATTEEPLSPDSPLWTAPNVLITSHSSAMTPYVGIGATEIFFDNLGRYLRGEPMRNEVTR